MLTTNLQILTLNNLTRALREMKNIGYPLKIAALLKFFTQFRRYFFYTRRLLFVVTAIHLTNAKRIYNSTYATIHMLSYNAN